VHSLWGIVGWRANTLAILGQKWLFFGHSFLPIRWNWLDFKEVKLFSQQLNFIFAIPSLEHSE
jgi:hypothetical protein